MVSTGLELGKNKKTNTMAKPICLIKVDNSKLRFVELFKVQEFFEKRLTDYHVLAVPFQQSSEEYDEPMQLQVFYEKDFTEVQYKELRSMVSEAIDSIKKFTQ